ncbi:uncharacterized protein V6R79_000529 [Siganus canaliculatus]
MDLDPEASGRPQRPDPELRLIQTLIRSENKFFPHAVNNVSSWKQPHSDLHLHHVVLSLFCCSVVTRAGTVTTCDLQDSAQILSCYDGLILVQNVDTSHRETEVCVDGRRPSRLEPPLCSSSVVQDAVETRCNGRSRCYVPMGLCHAAAPCLTRCVWMETTYSCAPGRSQVIRVLMANYGRTSSRVCRYRSPRRQPPDTSCRLHSALQVMAARCDGRHKCSVRASNLVFSNPCPGTRKYLKYSYTCVDPRT